MSNQRRYFSTHSDIKDDTAFVAVELDRDLLHRAEKEARDSGYTATNFLNDVLANALKARYPQSDPKQEQ